MRKILRKIFWSHWTPLGYLGSLSQKGRPKIFSKWVLINLSNPLRHPEPLVDPLLTKNHETAGPRCGVFFWRWSFLIGPNLNANLPLMKMMKERILLLFQLSHCALRTRPGGESVHFLRWVDGAPAGLAQVSTSKPPPPRFCPPAKKDYQMKNQKVYGSVYRHRRSLVTK